jgi:hypothetical protein
MTDQSLDWVMFLPGVGPKVLTAAAGLEQRRLMLEAELQQFMTAVVQEWRPEIIAAAKRFAAKNPPDPGSHLCEVVAANAEQIWSPGAASSLQKALDHEIREARRAARRGPRRTFSSPRALDLAVLAAVKEGSYTLSALRKVASLDVDDGTLRLALGRLVEGGELHQTGTGRKARYVPSNERYDQLGRITLHSDPFTASIEFGERHIEVYTKVFLAPRDGLRDELIGWGIREDEVAGVIKTLQRHAKELAAGRRLGARPAPRSPER